MDTKDFLAFLQTMQDSQQLFLTTIMDTKFAVMNDKLMAIDDKFAAKFTTMDKKLTMMDEKITMMDVRLQKTKTQLLQRFRALDKTVSDLNELIQRQELLEQYGQNFVKEFWAEDIHGILKRYPSHLSDINV